MVIRVTKREGKNILQVLRGRPDKMSLAIAQAFIDDTVHLEEGSERVIELDEYRPQ